MRKFFPVRPIAVFGPGIIKRRAEYLLRMRREMLADRRRQVATGCVGHDGGLRGRLGRTPPQFFQMRWQLGKGQLRQIPRCLMFDLGTRARVEAFA